MYKSAFMLDYVIYKWSDYRVCVCVCYWPLFTCYVIGCMFIICGIHLCGYYEDIYICISVHILIYHYTLFLII